MPLIGFACKKCGHSENRMVATAELKGLRSKQECPECGEESFFRQLGTTRSVSKISVDNGLQGKAVTLIPEVIDDTYKNKLK